MTAKLNIGLILLTAALAMGQTTPTNPTLDPTNLGTFTPIDPAALHVKILRELHYGDMTITWLTKR